MYLSILQNCFRRMSDTPRASIALHPLTAMLMEAPSSLRSLDFSSTLTGKPTCRHNGR